MSSGFEFDLGMNDDRAPWDMDGGGGFAIEPMSADNLLFQPDVSYPQFFGDIQGNTSSELSVEHNNSVDNLSVENSSGSMTANSHEDHDGSYVNDGKKLKRERNKASASKYRLKKKEYVTGLESEVEKLHVELSEKNGRVSALEAENRLLKEQLSFMQKLFAIASNNPGAVSGIAMAFVLLFAFVIPFNFSASPIATMTPLAPYSSMPAVPTQHLRKILCVQKDCMDLVSSVSTEGSVPEGMVQLVMISSNDLVSNITWFAELPKTTDGFHLEDQVCKVVSLQSVSSPQT